jgi:hypothetical protein
MKSPSNGKTPTRQRASHVDKLNRLTRLYLNLGLRPKDAVQAADADLEQLAFDLFHQVNGAAWRRLAVAAESEAPKALNWAHRWPLKLERHLTMPHSPGMIARRTRA